MSQAKMPASLGDIEFDMLVAQSDSYTADAPEYPVEEGFNVTDSIILKATVLDITAYITSTPVTWRQRFGHRNAEAVVEELKQLYFDRKPVTFRTSDGSYKNMAITGLTITKSKEAGYAYEIPISLKQVRVTAAQTVAVSISYSRGGATGTNAGTANTSNTAQSKSGSSAQSKKEGKEASSILYGVASSVGLFK